MPKGNTFETELLQLLFQNVALPDIGDAGGLQPSAVDGNLYVALHTGAGPGAGGGQNTNEATYTGYARVAVPRDAVSWDVTGDTLSNLIAITFGVCTAGANTITYASIGTDAAGAGKILYFGALTAPYNTSIGNAPEFAAGALTVQES